MLDVNSTSIKKKNSIRIITLSLSLCLWRQQCLSLCPRKWWDTNDKGQIITQPTNPCLGDRCPEEGSRSTPATFNKLVYLGLELC